MNLSLKLLLFPCQPRGAGEQGLGCHGGHRAKGRQAPTANEPAPSRGVPSRQPPAGLAGPSSTHAKAYQAQGKATTTSQPGASARLIIAGIAGES